MRCKNIYTFRYTTFNYGIYSYVIYLFKTVERQRHSFFRMKKPYSILNFCSLKRNHEPVAIPDLYSLLFQQLLFLRFVFFLCQHAAVVQVF